MRGFLVEMKRIYKMFFIAIFLPLTVHGVGVQNEMRGSKRVNPFYDSTRPLEGVTCFDSLIEMFRRRYEGWGFALLPPKVIRSGDQAGFYLRMVVESENTLRSPSVIAALKNPSTRAFFEKLGFEVEIIDEIIQLEIEEVRHGRLVTVGYTPQRHYQEILQIPDRSTLLFKMQNVMRDEKEWFGFFPNHPTEKERILSPLDWLRYLSKGILALSQDGDYFEHDVHDHLLAVLIFDPFLARLFQNYAGFLFQLYDHPQISAPIKRQLEIEIKALALRFEIGTTLIQQHISKSENHIWNPWARRRQEERLAALLAEIFEISFGEETRAFSSWSLLKSFERVRQRLKSLAEFAPELLKDLKYVDEVIAQSKLPEHHLFASYSVGEQELLRSAHLSLERLFSAQSKRR